MDISGEVVETGKEVKEFNVGDKVISKLNFLVRSLYQIFHSMPESLGLSFLVCLTLVANFMDKLVFFCCNLKSIKG
jgi:hypothetical protein